MNEHFKRQEPFEVPQNEQSVLALLKKIQQQLVFLERKVDALGGGASQRPFKKGRHFSRPPHHADGHSHHGDSRREQEPGQGHFPKPHFQDQAKEGHGFSHKKPFFRRKNRG